MSPAGAVSARTAVPPYAGPAARAVAVPGRATVGPFVPVGLRSLQVPAFAVPASIPPYHPLRPTPFASPAVRSTIERSEATAAPETGEIVAAAIPGATPAESTEGLPWIDAFLSSTPAMPLRAVEEQEHAEAWPLDEAAMELDAFTARVETERAPADHAPAGTSGSRIVIFPRMTAWSDEDMMDIMPVARADDPPATAGVWPAAPSGDASPEGGDLAVSVAPVRTAADTASSLGETPFSTTTLAAAPASANADAHEASAEEAAHALELLAGRVRAGELMLPGYDPRMGETAALVAALAALFGVRLR